MKMIWTSNNCEFFLRALYDLTLCIKHFIRHIQFVSSSNCHCDYLMVDMQLNEILGASEVTCRMKEEYDKY